MTTTSLLTTLLMSAQKVRELQKSYFAEKDPVRKKELLAASKAHERMFDILLTEAEMLIKNKSLTPE